MRLRRRHAATPLLSAITPPSGHDWRHEYDEYVNRRRAMLMLHCRDITPPPRLMLHMRDAAVAARAMASRARRCGGEIKSDIDMKMLPMICARYYYCRGSLMRAGYDTHAGDMRRQSVRQRCERDIGVYA